MRRRIWCAWRIGALLAIRPGQLSSAPTVIPALAHASALISMSGSTCGLRGGRLACVATQHPPGPPFRDVNDASQIWESTSMRFAWRCVRRQNKLACQQRATHGNAGPAPIGPSFGPLDDVVDVQLPSGATGAYVIRARGTVELYSFNDEAFHEVPGVTAAISLAKGPRHDLSFAWSDGPLHEEMCALQRSGEVQCWQGSEAYGPGQDGVVPATRRTVPGLTDAIQLVSGTYHVCALRKTGKVVCWGHRDYLGDGGASEIDTPVLVEHLQL